MTGAHEIRKPWELDPNERGISDPTDIIEHLEQIARCNTCRQLGTSAYFCAREIKLPDLRAHTMIMKNCETTIATGGMQPRHGRRPDAT